MPLFFRPAVCRTTALACRQGILHSHFLIAEDDKVVGAEAFGSAPLSKSNRKLLAVAMNPIVVSLPDTEVATAVLNYLNGIGSDDGILEQGVKSTCSSIPKAEFQFGTVG